MDRCRYRGEAVDGRKMEDPSPFLMGDAFSVIMVELSPLHFML